jgi:hypothetical protein
MKLLSDEGLHDMANESWNAYGQFTYVTNWKLAFPADYTNLNGSPNSLLPAAERSFTGTATIYLGVRLWSGAEAYLVPEVISELPFDQPAPKIVARLQSRSTSPGGVEERVMQICWMHGLLKSSSD